VAIAYEVDKPLLAANIGAAAPLIIKTLVQDQSVGLPAPVPHHRASGVAHTTQEHR
jgi:hypothetical protein